MDPLDNYYKSLDLSNNFAWKYIAVDGNGEVYLYFHEKPFIPSEGAESWRNASPEVGAILVERIRPPFGFDWRASLRSRSDIDKLHQKENTTPKKDKRKDGRRKIRRPIDFTPYGGLGGGLKITGSDGKPFGFFLASEVKLVFKKLRKIDYLLTKIVNAKYLASKSHNRSKQYVDTFYKLQSLRKEWYDIIEGLE